MKRAIRRPINFKQQSFETFFFSYKRCVFRKANKSRITYYKTLEFLVQFNSKGKNGFLCQKLERGHLSCTCLRSRRPKGKTFPICCLLMLTGQEVQDLFSSGKICLILGGGGKTAYWPSNRQAEGFLLNSESEQRRVL